MTACTGVLTLREIGPVPPFVLTSRLLPVVHGFSTRAGGVSQGACASLNLGFSVGDVAADVEENLSRFAGALGISRGALRRMSQVHGDRVLEVQGAAPTSEAERSELLPPVGAADGLWTRVPGLGLGVLTADCVPLLLVDPDGGRVAAVHSGWKGTLQRIAQVAVEALVGQGARAERLLAATGPCIRPCCYQVGAELGARFTQTFGGGVATADGEAHARLDLVEAVRRTLLQTGLREGHVDALPQCTACEPERFFSHRRDAGRTGRMLSVIVAPA